MVARAEEMVAEATAAVLAVVAAAVATAATAAVPGVVMVVEARAVEAMAEAGMGEAQGAGMEGEATAEAWAEEMGAAVRVGGEAAAKEVVETGGVTVARAVVVMVVEARKGAARVEVARAAAVRAAAARAAARAAKAKATAE